MNQKERYFVSLVLFLVAALAGTDLFIDSREGVVFWHILIEGAVGIFALIGMGVLLKGALSLQKKIESERNAFSEYKKEAEVWRAESQKYVEGLSLAIDQQLTRWKLTNAEREVAFLLLKGLGLKEIATIRNTTEKTARIQSLAVYSKSGLAGRSELAAFFLEDLLPPMESPASRIESPPHQF